jgi:hypothetical protein
MLLGSGSAGLYCRVGVALAVAAAAAFEAAGSFAASLIASQQSAGRQTCHGVATVIGKKATTIEVYFLVKVLNNMALTYSAGGSMLC